MNENKVYEPKKAMLPTENAYIENEQFKIT